MMSICYSAGYIQGEVMYELFRVYTLLDLRFFGNSKI